MIWSWGQDELCILRVSSETHQLRPTSNSVAFVCITTSHPSIIHVPSSSTSPSIVFAVSILAKRPMRLATDDMAPSKENKLDGTMDQRKYRLKSVECDFLM